MIINRDGKKIVLTREEAEAAAAILQKEKETGIPADFSEGGFKGDNCNSVIVPLPNGDALIAEANEDNNYREIFVGIGSQTNTSYYQDLAIVGAAYSYPSDAPVENPVKITDDTFIVRVYADEYDTDCTNEFEVKRYPGEET